MPIHPHANKRLSQIWFFYANMIGYVRLIFVFLSVPASNAAVYRNSFGWAAFAFVCNYTGGWLLDWIDGPIARKYKQCTVFGSAFDWYCDLLSQLVLVFWAAQLRHWLAMWLLIVFVLDLASALIDTNNTAASYHWTEFVPKHGFLSRVLNAVYPNGICSNLGTILWILYFPSACCHILLAHTPANYAVLTVALRGLRIVLFPFIIGYTLLQLAYLIAVVSGWKEPAIVVIEQHSD